MAQNYNECSVTLPKFTTFGFFIVILGESTVIDQTACCYVVTTSEIGLYVLVKISYSVYLLF